eukprot:5950465-Pyramimonas_sp.AAC.1
MPRAVREEGPCPWPRLAGPPLAIARTSTPRALFDFARVSVSPLGGPGCSSMVLAEGRAHPSERCQVLLVLRGPRSRSSTASRGARSLR